MNNVRVDDAAYAAVTVFYSHRQFIELLYTIGSYMMLARIVEVAEIEGDVVNGAAIVKHAEDAAKAQWHAGATIRTCSRYGSEPLLRGTV